jgi:hypothetical protein
MHFGPPYEQRSLGLIVLSVCALYVVIQTTKVILTECISAGDTRKKPIDAARYSASIQTMQGIYRNYERRQNKENYEKLHIILFIATSFYFFNIFIFCF